jgi:hypothetical protein
LHGRSIVSEGTNSENKDVRLFGNGTVPQKLGKKLLGYFYYNKISGQILVEFKW